MHILCTIMPWTILLLTLTLVCIWYEQSTPCAHKAWYTRGVVKLHDSKYSQNGSQSMLHCQHLTILMCCGHSCPSLFHHLSPILLTMVKCAWATTMDKTHVVRHMNQLKIRFEFHDPDIYLQCVIVSLPLRKLLTSYVVIILSTHNNNKFWNQIASWGGHKWRIQDLLAIKYRVSYINCG